uniref:Uncharacterized protein n=1 Tax=Rhizophora mucronata TaxID=61149 RepID=A0A2P2JGZ1_RHIMU
MEVAIHNRNLYTRTTAGNRQLKFTDFTGQLSFCN